MLLLFLEQMSATSPSAPLPQKKSPLVYLVLVGSREEGEMQRQLGTGLGLVAMEMYRATKGRSAWPSAHDWLHCTSASHHRSSTAWQAGEAIASGTLCTDSSARSTHATAHSTAAINRGVGIVAVQGPLC